GEGVIEEKATPVLRLRYDLEDDETIVENRLHHLRRLGLLGFDRVTREHRRQHTRLDCAMTLVRLLEQFELIARCCPQNLFAVRVRNQPGTVIQIVHLGHEKAEAHERSTVPQTSNS